MRDRSEPDVYRPRDRVEQMIQTDLPPQDGMRDRDEHTRPNIPRPQETRPGHSSSASSSSLSGHPVT